MPDIDLTKFPRTLRHELTEFYDQLVAMRNQIIPLHQWNGDRIVELAKRMSNDIERLKDTVDLLENELR